MEPKKEHRQLTADNSSSYNSCLAIINSFCMRAWRAGRRARRRVKLFLLSFGAFLALLITYRILKKYNYICFNSESEKVIGKCEHLQNIRQKCNQVKFNVEKLCEHYKSGEIGGTLCQDFCGEVPTISGYSCFPFHQ